MRTYLVGHGKGKDEHTTPQKALFTKPGRDEQCKEQVKGYPEILVAEVGEYGIKESIMPLGIEIVPNNMVGIDQQIVKPFKHTSF